MTIISYHPPPLDASGERPRPPWPPLNRSRREDDVFDLAELCWKMAQDEMTGQQIADELGWKSAAKVTYHTNIKNGLHLQSWDLARLTKKPNSVNGNSKTLVNQELTKVNWNERQFRELLS